MLASEVTNHLDTAVSKSTFSFDVHSYGRGVEESLWQYYLNCSLHYRLCRKKIFFA